MRKNLKTYENRLLKLKHRLNYLNNSINDIQELNRKIARLNKIIKANKGI